MSKIIKICKLLGCNNKVKLNRDSYCSQKCYWESLIGNTINKGRIRSEEYKNKQSLSHKGRKQTEGEKKKQIESQIGKKLSKETRQKIRDKAIGRKQTKEVKQNMSEKKKKFYANGGKPWNKGLTKETDERVKNIGLKVTKSLLGRKSPEHTLRMKEIWKDPNFINKQVKGRNLFPNKAELKLQNILNQVFFKGQFLFVGDYKKFIGGKCPDFIDPINNKIIELYGDYWHKGQDPQDRIDYFKQYGHNTLVVWESELKDIDNLKKKLGVFIL